MCSWWWVRDEETAGRHSAPSPVISSFNAHTNDSASALATRRRRIEPYLLTSSNAILAQRLVRSMPSLPGGLRTDGFERRLLENAGTATELDLQGKGCPNASTRGTWEGSASSNFSCSQQDRQLVSESILRRDQGQAVRTG
jgi:hypothetical protein